LQRILYQPTKLQKFFEEANEAEEKSSKVVDENGEQIVDHTRFCIKRKSASETASLNAPPTDKRKAFLHGRVSITGTSHKKTFLLRQR
jgi:hypothetical protein